MLRVTGSLANEADCQEHIVRNVEHLDLFTKSIGFVTDAGGMM